MILISLPIFLIAVVIHECAHGWVAYKLGDPTAKNAGRLTLNPLAHIDPMGTVFLPLMLVLMGSPIVFGWALPTAWGSKVASNSGDHPSLPHLEANWSLKGIIPKSAL